MRHDIGFLSFGQTLSGLLTKRDGCVAEFDIYRFLILAMIQVGVMRAKVRLVQSVFQHLPLDTSHQPHEAPEKQGAFRAAQ